MDHVELFPLSLVVVARPSSCDACNLHIKTGGAAHLVGPGRVRCAACVAAGIVAVGEQIVVRARTARRVFTTLGVALKSLVRLAWDRMRGRRRTGPARMRGAFEDLGPTYVKLGQLVASTQGIFPEEYCAELRGCLDRARPIGFDAVERVLRAELRRPLAEIFSDIDGKPLASASIAQVHAARMRDGTEVVLKVQRPGIGETIAADMRVLGGLARLAAATPRGALASPVAIVDDFAATLAEELDFTKEAANMERFNAIMRDLDQTEVIAPRVVPGLVTKRVLVMERFFGTRVDDVETLRAQGADLEAKLIAGMRAWFQTVVFAGFFHGDVHAGNLMALRDGRIGFLDFGIVGRLDPAQRQGVIDTLLCFASGDFPKLAATWKAMGSCEGEPDVVALARDLREVYEPLLASAVESVKYADMVPGLLRTAETHRLRLPKDFVLVTKQMLYFDRYAKKLAPKLNVFRDPRLVTPLVMDVLSATFAQGAFA